MMFQDTWSDYEDDPNDEQWLVCSWRVEEEWYLRQRTYKAILRVALSWWRMAATSGLLSGPIVRPSREPPPFRGHGRWPMS